jgi:hypothetical protein
LGKPSRNKLVTSIGFSCADPSAGIRRLFAQHRLCSAKSLLRSASHADSFAVHGWSRYFGDMQGRFIIGAFAFATFGSSAAFAAEPVKRWTCPKAEQPQQRQQQVQQQRTKPQGCPVTRTIPPVIDPTPTFLL